MAIVVTTTSSTGSKTLLEMCQAVASEVGFPEPSTMVGNTDATARQLFRIANRHGESMSQEGMWNRLVKEATFTLTSADQDYDLDTIAPGMRYIIPMTTWDRSDKRIVLNPITSREWQYLKGWTTIAGLNRRARIRNNQLEFEDTVSTADNGKTIAFEYVSNLWVTNSDGSEEKNAFTLDTDKILLDDELFILGMVWRFRKSKGLEFEDDRAEYMRLLRMQLARDGAKRTVSMGSMYPEPYAVFNVPDRNFG